MKAKRTETLQIEGMTCGLTCRHCVRAVEGSLRRVPGVEVLEAETGSARVRYDAYEGSRA